MTARQLARALRRATARSASKQARYESAARAVLRDLLRTAASRFERSATVFLTAAADGPGWTPPADDELLSLDEIVGSYRGQTDPIRQSAVADFFTAFGSAAEASGVKANWETTNPMIAAYLERTGSQITNVAETTRQNVRGIILRSYQDGLSVPDTASAIRAYADSISASRAALIARTEFVGLTRGASLEATQIVSQETGDTYLKRWMTAPGAEYPRHEDYEGLDGQTVALDALFDVGGEQLAYPGDPDGDPAEVCNCRCDIEYVEMEGGVAVEPEAAETQQTLASMTQATPQELASAARSQAVVVEPAVTTNLQAVADAVGGRLDVLDFRFKGADSLSRKIVGDAAEKQITNAESASRIVDALRYTVILDEESYAAGVSDTFAQLEARGYSIERTKSKWSGDVYKDASVVVRSPGGYAFEVQFHTPASVVARNEGHLLYEKWRLLDPASPEAVALEKRMKAIWAKIEPPPGALSLFAD